MTATLEMPQLSGGPKRARALVQAVDAEQNFRGHGVIVDCRRLLAGTRSFASELLQQLLVEHHASDVTIVNVDDAFADDLRAAARELSLEGRVEIPR